MPTHRFSTLCKLNGHFLLAASWRAVSKQEWPRSTWLALVSSQSGNRRNARLLPCRPTIKKIGRTRSSPAHRLSVAATSDSSLSVAALSLHSPSLGSGLQESVETSGAKQSPSPPCPANDSIRAMTITPDPEETARLEALASQAKGYALHMMRSTGSVPPTVIADTAEGFVFCVPSGLPDEAAKDRFADVARLLAVAHGARAIAMVVEAWVRLAKPGGHLDLDTPPSQAPDRPEMVVLMLEGRSLRQHLPADHAGRVREIPGVRGIPGTRIHLGGRSLLGADAETHAGRAGSGYGEGGAPGDGDAGGEPRV